MSTCFQCRKAKIDDFGVVCHFFDTPYVVNDPHNECHLMDEIEVELRVRVNKDDKRED